jgi:hypothetical protein
LEKWNDQSWHNDAMPHSTLYLTPEVDQTGDSPCVEVWVNYEDPEGREIPCSGRFIVEFLKDFSQESGSDVQLYTGEDEDIARQFARGADDSCGYGSSSGGFTADHPRHRQNRQPRHSQNLREPLRRVRTIRAKSSCTF